MHPPPRSMRPSFIARSVLSALAVALTSAAASVPARAQGSVANVDTEAPFALQADRLYQEGRHLESLALLERHLESAPNDYLAQVMAARETLVLGYVAGRSDSAKALLRHSISYGEGAQGVDSAGIDGKYLTMAARGRLALIEGPRTRAGLGAQVEREALALLAVDSLHAGAHNALGRVYLEIAQLSWIERILARALMGGSIVGRASWDSAERHLRRAMELQPERNLYYVDVGSLLVLRGRLDEARTVLEKALLVPLEIPAQEGFREEMRELLRQIEARQARSFEGTGAGRGVLNVPIGPHGLRALRPDRRPADPPHGLDRTGGLPGGVPARAPRGGRGAGP